MLIIDLFCVVNVFCFTSIMLDNIKREALHNITVLYRMMQVSVPTKFAPYLFRVRPHRSLT